MLNSEILVWQRGKWIRKVWNTAVALGAGCRLAFSLPDSFCLLKWKILKTCFCAHLKGGHYFWIFIWVLTEVALSALLVLWAGVSSFSVLASLWCMPSDAPPCSSVWFRFLSYSFKHIFLFSIAFFPHSNLHTTAFSVADNVSRSKFFHHYGREVQWIEN